MFKIIFSVSFKAIFLITFFCSLLGQAKSKDELIYIVKHDCGSCHGMTLNGGLGPNLLSERLKKLPKELLIDSITNGRPGTAMPPWQKLLSKEDISTIAGLLQQGEIQNHKVE